MSKYYRELGMMEKCDIYSSMPYDYFRIVITRWRLSNHNLMIETGRYMTPYTSREQRLCTLCQSIKDEHHAIFICPRYTDLRENHVFLNEYTAVGDVLKPKYTHMKDVASFLHSIESRRKELNI